MNKFKEWSIDNWFVYIIVSITPWALLYSLINHMFGWQYKIAIGIPLLVFQLTGMVLLILSTRVWDK